MVPSVPFCEHNPTPPGLLVVDDHELVRLGLRTLVLSLAGPTVQSLRVFEASTLEEGLLLYGQHQPDISLVLLDLQLPDAFGLAGLARFLDRFPRAPVLVLSGSNDPLMKRQAVQDGALAYLTKSGNLQEVVAYLGALNLSSAAEPRKPSPHSPADAAPEAPGGAHGRLVRTANGQVFHLTARQAQVLDWILSGRSNREIAEQTCLSEGTVKNHVSALLLLVGVRSRAQLISQLR